LAAEKNVGYVAIGLIQKRLIANAILLIPNHPIHAKRNLKKKKFKIQTI